MKITFVRHGFAQHNQGFLDEGEVAYSSDKYRNSYLTTKGKEQVRETIIPQVDLIFSSPLIRCIETTRILVGSEPTIYLCDELIETQGPYPCNCRERLEDIKLKYKNIAIDFLSNQYTPSYIKENMKQMTARANKCLNQIKAFASDEGAKSILIVTHCDWLESIFNRKFKNGEALTLEY